MGKIAQEEKKLEKEEYARKWRAANPEKIKEANKRYREKKVRLKGVMKPGPLWAEARERARKAEEEWNLMVMDVEVGEKCAATGELLAGKGSLEKIRKEGRWEKGNVWVVGEKAARLLREWSEEELRAVLEKVSEGEQKVSV